MTDSNMRAGAAAIALALCFAPATSRSQTVFLDLNTSGQFLSHFNLWNDNGGANAGNFDFEENPTIGVHGSRAVAVYQNTDTTATYNAGSWNFSTNGATIYVSTLILANNQSIADKIQIGLVNSTANGLNGNSGVAFESFRCVPNAAANWAVREQFKNAAGATAEGTLGNVPVTPGHWYKFLTAFTNTSGATGNVSASCALIDFGIDGTTPGSNIVAFSTVTNHAGLDIAKLAAVWPAIRAFQDAGIDAWDNFFVYPSGIAPVVTLSLTNATVSSGGPAAFLAVADGPGAVSFSWRTNGVQVPNATNTALSILSAAVNLTNVQFVAQNAFGAVTNAAVVTVLAPTLPAIANLPATGVQASFATLNGQVISTGGSAPNVAVFYGTADGSTNAAAWAHSLALGAQSGVFSAFASGFNSNTAYYFTSQAASAAGVAWAAPSRSFVTAPANTPVSGVAVLTQHNDLARTGANLNETQLNVTNVNTNQFGLVWSCAVDDQIYAQPLVMTNVAIPGNGFHNVVIVATVNNSVYAFDADTPGAAYWQTNLMPSGARPPRNTDMTGACGGSYNDFSGNMGIVSTPVIDPATGALYLVARTLEHGSSYVQRLHALDVATGAERPNSPVNITATCAGSGDGNVGGVLTFDAQKANQRPGLALVNGIVYITWSSHCDWGPYHGWLLGYDAATLGRSVVYNDTPNGSDGGIWMSGQAPAADEAGNLYLSTGNGTVDTTGGPNRGESFLKLTRNGATMTVDSWFTPFNYPTLEQSDIDLGSAGILLIPGTTLAMSGGKQGILYVVNRDNMGGLSQANADTNIFQTFSAAPQQLHGAMAWWDAAAASYGYLWPAASHLQQYRFDRAANLFAPTPFAQSLITAPSGQPGGAVSISANGTNSGAAVVWASHQLGGSANQMVRPGILRAFDARNVLNELWDSEMLSSRDTIGNFAKFVPPTIANGKVYMATFSGRLNVYGLFPPVAVSVQTAGGAAPLQLSWPKGALQSASNVSGPFTVVSNAAPPFTVFATNAQMFYRIKVK